MLLKLTNVTEGRFGDKLIINSEYIISFFETKNKDGKNITIAYGLNNNSWEVKESIDEIMKNIYLNHKPNKSQAA